MRIIENGTELTINPRQKKELKRARAIYYCGQCAAYHIEPDDTIHAIQGAKVDGEQLYWSNQDGWVSFESATLFGGKQNVNLPLEGRWETIFGERECYQKDVDKLKNSVKMQL